MSGWVSPRARGWIAPWAAAAASRRPRRCRFLAGWAAAVVAVLAVLYLIGTTSGRRLGVRLLFGGPPDVVVVWQCGGGAGGGGAGAAQPAGGGFAALVSPAAAVTASAPLVLRGVAAPRVDARAVLASVAGIPASSGVTCDPAFYPAAARLNASAARVYMRLPGCRTRAAALHDRIFNVLYSTDYVLTGGGARGAPVAVREVPRSARLRPLPALPSDNAGGEDPRVFTWRGREYMLFNMDAVLEDGATIGRRLYLYRLDADAAVVLDVGGGGGAAAGAAAGAGAAAAAFALQPREKNWTPVVVGGDLFMVYAWDPLIVLRCEEDGSCRVVAGPGTGGGAGAGAGAGGPRGPAPFSPSSYTAIRGSTTARDVPGWADLGYRLTFVHSRVRLGGYGALFYRTHAVVTAAAPAWAVVAMSPPLAFDWRALGVDLLGALSATDAQRAADVLHAHGRDGHHLQSWLDYVSSFAVLEEEGGGGGAGGGARFADGDGEGGGPPPPPPTGPRPISDAPVLLWGYAADRLPYAAVASGIVEAARRAAAAHACTVGKAPVCGAAGGPACVPAEACSAAPPWRGFATGELDATAVAQLNGILEACTPVV
jgi:hypothetical protein